MRNLITREYWNVERTEIDHAIITDFPVLEKALRQMFELNERIEQVTAEFRESEK